MAAFMADYELFQIEITRTYGKNEWRDDIRKLFRKSGVDGQLRDLLFFETNRFICLSSRQKHRFSLQRFSNCKSSECVFFLLFFVDHRFLFFRKTSRSSKTST